MKKADILLKMFNEQQAALDQNIIRTEIKADDILSFIDQIPAAMEPHGVVVSIKKWTTNADLIGVELKKGNKGGEQIRLYGTKFDEVNDFVDSLHDRLQRLKVWMVKHQDGDLLHQTFKTGR